MSVQSALTGVARFAIAALVLLTSGCGDKPAAPAAKPAQPKPAAAATAKPPAAPTAPAANAAPAPAAEKPLDAAGIEEIFAGIETQDALDLEIAPLIDATNADQWIEKLARELEEPPPAKPAK